MSGFFWSLKKTISLMERAAGEVLLVAEMTHSRHRQLHIIRGDGDYSNL